MSNQTKLLSSATRRTNIDNRTSILGLDGAGAAIIATGCSVFVKRPEVTDANDATITGYYSLCGQGVANIPPAATYGILLVFEDGAGGGYGSGTEFVQVILSISTPPHIYIRKKGAGSGWGAWYDIQGTAVT